MVLAGDLAFWRDRLEGSSRHGLFLLLAQVTLRTARCPHPDGIIGIHHTPLRRRHDLLETGQQDVLTCSAWHQLSRHIATGHSKLHTPALAGSESSHESLIISAAGPFALCAGCARLCKAGGAAADGAAVAAPAAHGNREDRGAGERTTEVAKSMGVELAGCSGGG